MADTTEMRKDAEKLKNLGNEEYLAGRFSAAVGYYTQAISLRDDEPKYYQNRAAAYYGMGQYDSALADCERALELDPTFVKAVVRGAKCLAKLGRVDEAIARLLSVSVEDPLVEAIRLKTEGNAAWKREEYQAAAELYTQALDVLGDVDVDERAKILCNRSGSYHKLGRFEAALRDADEAEALDSSFAKAHLRRKMALEGLGRHDEAGADRRRLDHDKKGAERRQGGDDGTAWSRLMEALNGDEQGREFLRRAMTGDGSSASFHEAMSNMLGQVISGERGGELRRLFEQATGVEARRDERHDEAVALGLRGLDFAKHGRFREAIGCFEQCLSVFQALGRRDDEGKTYGNMGIAYQSLGQNQTALGYFEKQLAIARDVGDRNGEGAAYGNMGVLYQSLGQYQTAIDYSEKQLAIARELGDRAGEGAAYGNMGATYRTLGQYRKAIEYLEQALPILRAVGDRAAEGKLYGNLGGVCQSLGQHHDAIGYFERDLAIARELGDRFSEGTTYSNLGLTYLVLGQLQKAIEYMERALPILRDVGHRVAEGNVYGNLATAFLSLGQFDRAAEYCEKHLAFVREVGDRAREGQALHNMGRSFHIRRNHKRAIDLLSQAMHSRESLWADLGTDEASKITLLEQLGRTYRVLQMAQIKAGQHESALETAERGRARTLVDRLSRSDATFQSDPLSASAMRSLAKSCGTVVVVYSVVKEDKLLPETGLIECVYTWVITPDAITFDRHLPPRPLIDLANDVTALINGEDSDASKAPVLTELYDLLIRPIESSLNLSDTDDPPIITFIPQGPLLFVPFAALHDSETNLDLIDRCVVSISPCVAVLKRESLSLATDENRGLAIGNPTGDLRNFELASRVISNILGLANDSVLIGEQATKAAVIDRLRTSPRHVLFACHGEAPPTSVGLARDEDEATLLLSGKIRLGERDVAGIDLRSTALVDLSACWLARGKTSVEGALNLSRACMVAGAQSVIGALTPVYDLPTSVLMIRFYHRLLELELDDGQGWLAARALRDAQLWLRSSTPDELISFVSSFEPRDATQSLGRHLMLWFSLCEGDLSHVFTTTGPPRALRETREQRMERAGKLDSPLYWAPFEVVGRY